MRTNAYTVALTRRRAPTLAEMLKRFGWRLAVALALTSLAVPHRAHAQEEVQAAQEAGATAPMNSEIGHATESWLALQRSNSAAAPAQPMLGAEAGYAYKRYLKSFDTEIPATFGSSVKSGGVTSGGEVGQGGGASGGAY
ncbi:DUF3613 domain-containing protein [Paraburkholderia sp. J94]|uniref:DUF3613 domain-containing protein n=1 Tax=Paraburkholderia sp. J94 TaxID=2805441 RepID=UPI002AB230F2|nr:DUF3613 domain-containing protein [Paraburkholderia sp. J94]